MPDPSPRNVTLRAAPPLCTDCRWCLIEEASYEEPQCTSPKQPMSVVDGKPRWPECYLQRGEDDERATYHHDLCRTDGRYFEPREGEPAKTHDEQIRDATIEECQATILGGSFLHDAAPAKQFAKEVVEALDRIKSDALRT